MILQLHEIKEPIPQPIIPGDLSQWAVWYVAHLINGGRRVDLGWRTVKPHRLSRR